MDWQLTEKQKLAWKTLLDPGVAEVLYGGGKGGGKTVFLCIFAYKYAKLIEKCLKLPKTAQPLCIGFMGRARAVDFAKTTLQTWKYFIPAGAYILNEQRKTLTILSRDYAPLYYDYGGMDDEDAISKFNSAEYVVLHLDQAEEFTRDEVGTLRGTLYRFKTHLNSAWYKILFTANPAPGFLKDDFIKNPIPSRRFVQALYSDNTFIDQDKYKEQLIEAWKHRPEMVQALVYGDWERIEGANLLFTDEIITNGLKVVIPDKRIYKTCTAIDPAWTGDKSDEAVIYTIANGKIIDQIFTYDTDTIKLAGLGVAQAERHNSKGIFIDSIGIGAGVYDNADKYSKDIPVHKLVSSSRGGKEYYNLRAEMYWYASGEVAGGRVRIPDDTELIRELREIRYFIHNGLIQIEPKEEIKKRLGRSPDRADAFIMAIFGTQRVEFTYLDYKMREIPQEEGTRVYRGF